TKGRRPSRSEHQPPLLIQAHSTPTVRAAGMLPGILRPGFISELSGVWDGAKDPAQLAGAKIIGTNMAGSRRQFFTHDATDDEEIFVNYPGCGNGYRDFLEIAAEPFSEINPSSLSKCGHEF